MGTDSFTSLLGSAGPSQWGQGPGSGGGEKEMASMVWQGVLAAKVYLLVALLLPCCYINIMNCSQVHQMRFRWSLGALLPKQAKSGRADASGKLQSLSRSTKLELMKVGEHLALMAFTAVRPSPLFNSCLQRSTLCCCSCWDGMEAGSVPRKLSSPHK